MSGWYRLVALLLLFPQHQAVARAAADMNVQLASSRSVAEIALSPDGLTVGSIITDPTAEGGHRHLWILSKASAPRQISGSDVDRTQDDSNPAWESDGRTVLYLSKAAEGAAIKRVEIASGRVDTLLFERHGTALATKWGTTRSENSVVVKGFSLARSGALAVLASDGPGTAETRPPKADEHRFGQTERIRLYVVADQTSREIGVPENVRSVSWSDDSRRLLIVTEPSSDDLGDLNRLWLAEGSSAPREIRGTAENVQAASWLPSGQIAYIARCSRNAPTVCYDLYVQGLDGTAPRNLTDGIDGSLIEGGSSGPVVTRSGDVLVTVARRFTQQVARIRPLDGRLQWTDSLPAVVRSIATNTHQNAFALLAAERGSPAAVALADAQLRSYALLAGPDLQPKGWAPLKARRLEWVNEAQTIDALLYLPDASPSGERVPLVVDVHGGPAGRFDDSDYPLVRLLLAEGWAVLHVNPRGSLGYGSGFLAAVQDDLGGVDYRDVMTGVDAAIAQAPIDKDRLAMIGYSYGATITAFALGRTDRFKVLVAAAPVVNQISEYGTESSSWYDRWYFGQPWKRLEAAWRQSPLAGVGGAKTPLLLLQGESDPVNPLGQSLELFRALRQVGSPVELILFPRETHRDLGQNYYGFTNAEPHHGMSLRQRILDVLHDAFAGKSGAGLVLDERP
jgi:dipeptidyl aminopeptidase/acylaminoacyl peptidase